MSTHQGPEIPYRGRGADPYVEWLQRLREGLFYAGGTTWRLYSGRVVIPASVKPTPIQLTISEARQLLREAGADLVRWFSRTSDEPTAYWYVICDRCDFDALPRKARNQIRKAQRECTIRSVDAEWIAQHGYACYVAAFGRYKHGHPITSAHFARIQRSCAGGPFEFLGAFVGDQLAGFAKCAIIDDVRRPSIVPPEPSAQPLASVLRFARCVAAQIRSRRGENFG